MVYQWELEPIKNWSINESCRQNNGAQYVVVEENEVNENEN